MTNFSSSFEELRVDFINNGIPVDKPGFYDEPNFVNIEKARPDYLDNYARFVATKEFSPDYINRARREIPVIANILHDELVKDGRQGACIDASQVLSRIFEREGFWCYIAKGALTIHFPPSSHLEPKHFCPIDTKEIDAGHVWVVAPPYHIVDITVKQQPYQKEERDFLPDLLLQQGVIEGRVNSEDILSESVRLYLQLERVSEEQMIARANPNVLLHTSIFKPNIVSYNITTLKYIQVASSASDGQLEDIIALKLSGRTGIQIYKEIILPTLSELRSGK